MWEKHKRSLRVLALRTTYYVTSALGLTVLWLSVVGLPPDCTEKEDRLDPPDRMPLLSPSWHLVYLALLVVR